MGKSGPRFAPSSKKLKDARKRGDVAKSRVLTAAVIICGTVLACLGAGNALADFSGRAGSHFALSRECLEADLQLAVLPLFGALGLRLIVILSAIWVCALIAEYGQGGFAFCAVEFKGERLSPGANLARLFGCAGENGFQFMESIFGHAFRHAALLLFSVVGLAVGVLFTAAQLAAFDAVEASDYGAGLLLITREVVPSSVVVLIAFGAVEFIWARKRRLRRLEMDLEEVKRELRESEGDPEQRALKKQLYMELISQATVSAVRRAQAVVVGKERPSH